MERTEYELSQIIEQFGAAFVEQYHPNSFTVRTLDALQQCRTQALGGHKEKCDNDSCAHERFSYNSCGNRHCPSPRWIIKVITQPVFEIYLSAS